MFLFSLGAAFRARGGRNLRADSRRKDPCHTKAIFLVEEVLLSGEPLVLSFASNSFPVCARVRFPHEALP